MLQDELDDEFGFSLFDPKKNFLKKTLQKEFQYDHIFSRDATISTVKTAKIYFGEIRLIRDECGPDERYHFNIENISKFCCAVTIDLNNPDNTK